MTDHFTLDVDPASLRKAADDLETLRTNVMAKATTVGGTPGEIGERWTGTAATDVTTEMESLGSRMTGLGGFIAPIYQGLRTLARSYDQALKQLPDLNRRWNEAQTTYDDAVTASENQRTRDEDATAPEGGGRNPLQHEHDDAHTTRVSEAGTALRNAQGRVQDDFDALEQQLEADTSTLSGTLSGQTPMSVSAEQIEEYRSGGAPQLDRSGIATGMTLMDRREREAAQQRWDEDQEALDEALENGDPEEVEEALEAIGANADDPYYTDVMVDELGAEGVQEYYLAIDQHVRSGTTDMETLWSSLEGFNDAVAAGVSQRSDEEMGEFAEAWMAADHGPKIWALVAASDHADGRINALALAHQSEIYNSALSDITPGMFPNVFNFAYGDQDMLDQLDDRSSGEDLADVLESAPDSYVEALLEDLHDTQVDGGSMNYDEYQHIADLFRETLESFVARSHAADAMGRNYDLDRMMQIANSRYMTDGAYLTMLNQGLSSVVNDSAFMYEVINDAYAGRGVDPTELKNLISDSGVPVSDLVADLMTNQLASGKSPESAAAAIGALLQMGDIIDSSDARWGEVAGAMLQDAALTPLPDAVVPGIEEVLSQLEAVADDEDAMEDQFGENAPQRIIAFSLYVQNYGLPPGYEDFVERNQPGIDDGTYSETHLISDYRDYLFEKPDGQITPAEQDALEKLDEIFGEIDQARG